MGRRGNGLSRSSLSGAADERGQGACPYGKRRAAAAATTTNTTELKGERNARPRVAASQGISSAEPEG